MLQHCRESGVLVRTAGDTLVLSPPPIISAAEIDRLFSTIRSGLLSLNSER